MTSWTWDHIPLAHNRNNLPHTRIWWITTWSPNPDPWKRPCYRPCSNHQLITFAAKKRAGINRRLRIYDFRHSFATTVLGQEADLKSTSEILGHSRPETTMKHYHPN